MFRFKLRHLMYLATAVALVCGYFAWQSHRRHAMRETIDALWAVDARWQLQDYSTGRILHLYLPTNLPDELKERTKILPKAPSITLWPRSKDEDAILTASDVELFFPSHCQDLYCLDVHFTDDAIELLKKRGTSFTEVAYNFSGSGDSKILRWWSEMDSIREADFYSDAAQELILDGGYRSLEVLEVDITGMRDVETRLDVRKLENLRVAELGIYADLPTLKLEQNRRLESVEIKGGGGQQTNVTISECPAIRELSVSGVACTPELWEAVGTLRHLETLEIGDLFEENSNPVRLPDNLANLRQLTIRYSWFSAENVAEFHSLNETVDVTIDDLKVNPEDAD